MCNAVRMAHLTYARSNRRSFGRLELQCGNRRSFVRMRRSLSSFHVARYRVGALCERVAGCWAREQRVGTPRPVLPT